MAQPIPSDHHKYLHLLLLMSTAIELMDDIEGTQHYKHGIKAAAKQFIREVCPVLEKDIDLLCRNVDGKAITNLLKEYEGFSKELTNHFTSDFPVLQAMLEQYRNDPQFVLTQLDIAVVTKDTDTAQMKIVSVT
jgi:hypothetical protein